jgi:predicted kinase
MINRLVMTVGLPRSGKSTWAKSQVNIPIVNPDSIRLALHGKPFLPKFEIEVWHIAHVMVKSLFLAGHNLVILDATNITCSRRKEWVDDQYQIILKYFDTPKDVCIKRAIDTNQMYLLPVIVKMSNQLNSVYEHNCLLKELNNNSITM